MKTKERTIAEKIKETTGLSLFTINSMAFKYLDADLCSTRLEALEYILQQEVK